MAKKKILLSAFSCAPYRGSEPGSGWNWAVGLARKGYEVHCLTRGSNRAAIERCPTPPGLFFHYITLFGFEWLYGFSQATMYFYYFFWQVLALRTGKKLYKRLGFDIAHHVSWGNFYLGSFLYKLPVPFLFGPAGGGQFPAEILKEYFSKNWRAEEKRFIISRVFSRINPACFEMIRTAKVLIASNRETEEMVKKKNPKNVYFSLDVALPESFIPTSFCERTRIPGQLKLLWVGRVMPRKGLLLVLDVMRSLRPFSGITLTVVGDGAMRKEVAERIKTCGLGNNVHLTGDVPFEKVRLYYASHDVFFFTSLRESGGCQLIEAMAFGLPVVTLDLHGQAAIVSDRTGIKIPVDAPRTLVENLAEAILDLSKDNWRYGLLSRAAYEFAKLQTWENKIEDITARFYDEKEFDSHGTRHGK